MNNRWLELIESDYLKDYIASGGSAVKFAIAPDQPARSQTIRALAAVARSNTFLHFSLDSENTRLHFIHTIFHDIARRLDWDRAVAERLKNILSALGLSHIPNQAPFDLSRLAALNGRDNRALVQDLQNKLAKELGEDRAMTHEFQIAILHLLLANLRGGNGPLSPHRSAILSWLQGQLPYIKELKAARIYQKVTRSNARHLLSSLAHFVRQAGSSGIVVTLDISRYLTTCSYSSRQGGNYYSAANALDLYELLRQLIDEQDTLEGMLIVVVAPPELLTDSFRGLNRYQALKMRLIDDVRVRARQNLLAPLVHV
jgi:hypothetical protein